MLTVTRTGTLRILDADIENRPLSYWYDGNPTAEVTAIAWGWTDEEHVDCMLLTPDPASAERMLLRFRDAYEEADMLTGHYFRSHDLPILNAAYVEYGYPPLGPKLVSDTKTDLVRWKDLPKSQEYLGDLFETPQPKQGMSQHQWREANRLTPQGTNATRARVVSDVVQHKQLRAALIERGLLGPPRVWSP